MMTGFSVIVPVYNVEDYLPECIEHLRSQSHDNFEVILVDDGSTDKCAEICDEICSEDYRFKVVHKPNGGLVSARKEGLKIAKGEYVLNVDSDDFLEKDFLIDLDEIINHYHPDIIAFDYQEVDEKGNKGVIVNNLLQEGLYSNGLLNSIRNKLIYNIDSTKHNTGLLIYSIWSKAIRRDVLFNYQNSVSNKIRNGEDLAVVMPVVCNSDSLYIYHKVGYYYRQRMSSMVHSFKPDELDSVLKVFHHLQINCSMIPMESLFGYGYRLVLIQTINAANAYDFKSFKDYMNHIYCGEIQLIVNQYYQNKLNVLGKLRHFLIKHKCWFLTWFILRLRHGN